MKNKLNFYITVIIVMIGCLSISLPVKASYLLADEGQTIDNSENRFVLHANEIEKRY